MNDTFGKALAKLGIDFDEGMKQIPAFKISKLPHGVNALDVGNHRYGGWLENDELFAWYMIDKHFGFSFDKRISFEKENGL
jgi:hypothetical protein